MLKTLLAKKAALTTFAAIWFPDYVGIKRETGVNPVLSP
jgi:hypothetical protein